MYVVSQLKSIQADMSSYTAQISPSKIKSNGIIWLLVLLLHFKQLNSFSNLGGISVDLPDLISTWIDFLRP